MNPFEEFVAVPSGNGLQALIAKAEEAIELERHLETLEEEAKQIKSRLNTIKQEEVPELMSDLGLDDFKMKDGTKIKIQNFVSGSLPKEEDARRQAFNWLESAELGDIIKTNVSLAFGKGEDNFAKNAIELLKQEGYDPKAEKGVHPQTLYAAVRDLMSEGAEVPLEMLGLYAGRTAKFTLGKGK